MEPTCKNTEANTLKMYKVIEGHSVTDISATVNAHLKDGYVPIGGVQVVTICLMNDYKGCEECETTFYQAVALKT